MHGLLWFLGVYPVPSGTSAMYQLWSGLIPALTVFTLLGAVVSMYHLHNCAADGCWRIGKHKVSGTPWCSRHQEKARPQLTELDLLEEISTRVLQVLEELRQPR